MQANHAETHFSIPLASDLIDTQLFSIGITAIQSYIARLAVFWE